MLIRHKLMLNTAISVASLVAMFGLLVYSGGVLTDLTLAAQRVVEVDSEVLTLRKHEKDFITRLDPSYLDKHKEVAQNVASLFGHLTLTFDEYDIPSDNLHRVETDIADYLARFSDLVALTHEIGLTPKTGLYGELREAVHSVETLLKEQNEPALMVVMLQLRRNEKDFMLRKKLSYLEKFEKNIAVFESMLVSSALSSDLKNNISGLMNQYLVSFKRLVDKERERGLNKDEGKTSQLRAAVRKAEEDLENMKEQALEAIHDSEASMKVLGLVIFFVIAAILCIFAYLIIRSIMTPVTRITHTISDIENNKDLTLRCDATAEDELGQIGRHFNSMVESFQKLIEEVSESVEIVNHSCGELSHNAVKASEGVDRQLNETDMVATAITEMGATIDEIAKNTELAAAKASTTHDNAQQGQSGVEETIEKIQSLAEQLNGSAQVVAELESDSETIGSVLDVIRGIAEQTNLLALNAAIEAARAGEQGRGFAVVADEVRSLAMRTQESTEEIASIIQTLQSRTQSIVQLMESSQKQGGESAEQATEAGIILQQINTDVTNIMDMSTQIAAAIEEQSMVASEVNKNVVIIRDIAQESATAANENAQASEEVKARAYSLHQAVSIFKV